MYYFEKMFSIKLRREERNSKMKYTIYFHYRNFNLKNTIMFNIWEYSLKYIRSTPKNHFPFFI